MRFEYRGTTEQLVPKAVAALRNLEGVQLYHSEQGMRHPLEIYATTFGDVMEQTISLIDLVNRASTELPYIGDKNPDWQRPIAIATDQWLDSLIQHIDSCKGVLSCFFSQENTKAQSKRINAFSKGIEPYRKQVATIVNLIKHKHRFLRIMYFHWVGGFVPGYFVEGVVEEGLMGPDPLVHEGANTAISFSRDIPAQICNVFFVSSVLAQHVYEVTKRPPRDDKERPYRDANLASVLKQISIMPMTFFPDEASKPVPFIKYHEEGNGRVRVLIEMPAKRARPSGIPVGATISTSWRIGEIAKSCKLPYFGHKAKV